MDGTMSQESELKARAVFDAYTTLRAVEFALRKIQPLVAAHCEESRDLLAEAFPELQRVERVLQLTEEEIKAGGSAWPTTPHSAKES
jgi:hypothetical protein